MCGFAHTAMAADLDYLRGSEVFAPGPALYPDWSGFYLGGQVGYANAQMDFATATASLVARMLRNSSLESLANVSQWSVLGPFDTRNVTYGALAGYNVQFENTVLGIEANYNHTSLSGSSSDTLSRQVTPGDGFTYNVTVSSLASLKLTDYGTLRGRAGYAVGQFLPYAMVGFAMGRFESLRSASVSGTFVPAGALGPVSNFAMSLDEPKAVYAYGYSLGGGVDVALLPCLFLRGEFEWVQFANLQDVSANFITGRVAAAYKF